MPDTGQDPQLDSTPEISSDDPGYLTSCYGRRPHRWSAPIKSDFWGCTVKSCPICGRVTRA